jgi:hypothetical protein
VLGVAWAFWVPLAVLQVPVNTFPHNLLFPLGGLGPMAAADDGPAFRGG